VQDASAYGAPQRCAVHFLLVVKLVLQAHAGSNPGVTNTRPAK